MSVPVVRLGGTALPWDLARRLLGVTVDAGLRRAARAEVVLADDGFELLRTKAAQFAPGTALTVGFTDGGTTGTVFCGTVTGLRVTCPEAGDHTAALAVVAHDAAHGLGQVQQALALSGVALGDAVAQALRQHVTTGVHVGGLPTGNREHLIVACSPLALLDEVCDRYGATWWCDAADGSLHVAAATAAADGAVVTLRPGEHLARLDVEAGTGAPGTVVVRAWDPAAKQALTGTGTAGTPDGPGTALTGAHGAAVPDAARRHEARSTCAADAQDVEAQADGVAALAAAAAVRLMACTFGVQAQLVPGSVLDLADAGPLTGRYPVTAVRHVWGGTATTWACSAPGAPGGAVPGMPGADPGAAGGGAGAGRGAGSGPRAAQGLMLAGTVDDVKDPQGQGRVTVKLPTLGPDVTTGWARTLLPGAGPKRGLVVPHRTDDEVVVGFEEGDLQRPVVLGAVHNGKDAVPTATAGRDADISAGLTSAKGHKLVLTDASAAGDSGLVLTHADGHGVSVDGEQVLVQAKQGTPLKLVSGQASIVLDGSGDITIKGVKVTVQGSAQVSVKGPQVQAQADTTLDLKGLTTTVKGTSVTVQADAMASVKGATVAIN